MRKLILAIPLFLLLIGIASAFDCEQPTSGSVAFDRAVFTAVGEIEFLDAGTNQYKLIRFKDARKSLESVRHCLGQIMLNYQPLENEKPIYDKAGGFEGKGLQAAVWPGSQESFELQRRVFHAFTVSGDKQIETDLKLIEAINSTGGLAKAWFGEFPFLTATGIDPAQELTITPAIAENILNAFYVTNGDIIEWQGSDALGAIYVKLVGTLLQEMQVEISTRAKFFSAYFESPQRQWHRLATKLNRTGSPDQVQRVMRTAARFPAALENLANVLREQAANRVAWMQFWRQGDKKKFQGLTDADRKLLTKTGYTPHKWTDEEYEVIEKIRALLRNGYELPVFAGKFEHSRLELPADPLEEGVLYVGTINNLHPLTPQQILQAPLKAAEQFKFVRVWTTSVGRDIPVIANDSNVPMFAKDPYATPLLLTVKQVQVIQEKLEIYIRDCEREFTEFTTFFAGTITVFSSAFLVTRAIGAGLNSLLWLGAAGAGAKLLTEGVRAAVYQEWPTWQAVTIDALAWGNSSMLLGPVLGRFVAPTLSARLVFMNSVGLGIAAGALAKATGHSWGEASQTALNTAALLASGSYLSRIGSLNRFAKGATFFLFNGATTYASGVVVNQLGDASAFGDASASNDPGIQALVNHFGTIAVGSFALASIKMPGVEPIEPSRLRLVYSASRDSSTNVTAPRLQMLRLAHNSNSAMGSLPSTSQRTMFDGNAALQISPQPTLQLVTDGSLLPAAPTLPPAVPIVAFFSAVAASESIVDGLHSEFEPLTGENLFQRLLEEKRRMQQLWQAYERYLANYTGDPAKRLSWAQFLTRNFEFTGGDSAVDVEVRGLDVQNSGQDIGGPPPEGEPQSGAGQAKKSPKPVALRQLEIENIAIQQALRGLGRWYPIDLPGVDPNARLYAVRNNETLAHAPGVRIDAKAIVIAFSGAGAKTSGAHFWMKAAQVLDRYRIAVIAVEHPFHGEGTTDPRIMEGEFYFRWLAKIVAVYRTSGIPVYLVGKSYGAAPVQELLYRHPNIAKAATIFAPGADVTATMGVHRLRYEDVEVAKQPEMLNPLGAAWERHICATLTSQDRDLSTTVPIKVVWGDTDEFSTPELLGEMISHYNNGHIVVVKDGTHDFPAEHKYPGSENSILVDEIIAMVEQVQGSLGAPGNWPLTATSIVTHKYETNPLFREFVDAKGKPLTVFTENRHAASAVLAEFDAWYMNSVLELARKTLNSDTVNKVLKKPDAEPTLQQIETLENKLLNPKSGELLAPARVVERRSINSTDYFPSEASRRQAIERLVQNYPVNGFHADYDSVADTIRVTNSSVDIMKMAKARVLLLHGMGAASSGHGSWIETMRRIGDPTPGEAGSTKAMLQELADYVPLAAEAIELPGQGVGPAIEKFVDTDVLVEWLARYIRTMMASTPELPLMLVGRSASANLVLALVKKYPQLVSSVVLVSPTKLATDASELAEQLAITRESIWQEGAVVVDDVLNWAARLFDGGIWQDPQAVGVKPMRIFTGSTDPEVTAAERAYFRDLSTQYPNITYQDINGAPHDVFMTGKHPVTGKRIEKSGWEALQSFYQFIADGLR